MTRPSNGGFSCDRPPLAASSVRTPRHPDPEGQHWMVNRMETHSGKHSLPTVESGALPFPVVMVGIRRVRRGSHGRTHTHVTLTRKVFSNGWHPRRGFSTTRSEVRSHAKLAIERVVQLRKYIVLPNTPFITTLTPSTRLLRETPACLRRFWLSGDFSQRMLIGVSGCQLATAARSFLLFDLLSLQIRGRPCDCAFPAQVRTAL